MIVVIVVASVPETAVITATTIILTVITITISIIILIVIVVVVVVVVEVVVVVVGVVVMVIGVDLGVARERAPIIEKRPCIYHFLLPSAPHILVCQPNIFDKSTPV